MRYECKKCGHRWSPRTERKPVACPKCKRYDWDKRPCTACNGSGKYDAKGSPLCVACNGTGEELA